MKNFFLNTIRKKKIQVSRLTIIAIKILLVILFYKFLINTSQIKLDLLLTAFHQPFLACLILLLFYLMIVVCTWRWHRLNVAQKIPLSFTKSLFPTYVGTGFNNVLPGSVGGDILKTFYVLKNVQAKKARIILSILFDRISGLMGIFIMVSIATLINHKNYMHNPSFAYLLIGCGIICFIGFVTFMLTFFLPQEMGLQAWLLKRFPNKSWVKLISSFIEAVTIYRNSKLIILESIFASLIIQFLLMITVTLIAKMMGMPEIPLLDYGLALAITQIVNLIPVAPGGLGIGEIAFANTLLSLHPDMVAAYATIFVAFRLFGLICYLPGIIFYIFSFKSGEIQRAQLSL